MDIGVIKVEHGVLVLMDMTKYYSNVRLRRVKGRPPVENLLPTLDHSTSIIRVSFLIHGLSGHVDHQYPVFIPSPLCPGMTSSGRLSGVQIGVLNSLRM